MRAGETERAVVAARSIAASLGLAADEAVVLQRSNKLTLRLLPGDVLARVSRAGDHVFPLEIELARQLTASGSPVAALDPRVEPRPYERDGFAVTLWTYYPPVTARETAADDTADEYAAALARLHTGMGDIDVPAPHFTARVERAQQLVASPDRTPALDAADRDLLAGELASRRQAVTERAAAEQLLHGEPHPDNVVDTEGGLRFVDLEACCRGPVEFDLAHAPEAVGERYPGLDRDLLRQCRNLVLAMVTAWRWDREDRLPQGHRLAAEWTSRLRAVLDGGGQA